MSSRHTPLESKPVEPEACTLDVWLQVLHRVPFFANLSHTEVAEINPSFTAHGYQAGEIIYFTGDAANRLYVVATGRVKLLRHILAGQGDESLKDDFLHEEHRLAKAYSLIYHLPTGQQHGDEVAFYQLIRNQVRKLSPKGQRNLEDLDRAVQDLLDASIEAQPAVDIFKVAGLDKPDISILDDEFLAGFKDQPHQDLQVRLLHKLMLDELNARRRHNLMQVRSFKQMLEETITRYNNNTLQAAEVVRVMVEIRRQQQATEQRKRDLGLSDEELAFYDVIALGAPAGLPTDNEWIAGLVQDVVRAVKNNLKVDWTRSHRRDVYASVESAVKMVLRRRKVKGEQFQFILNRLMIQAETLYEDWPLAA